MSNNNYADKLIYKSFNRSIYVYIRGGLTVWYIITSMIVIGRDTKPRLFYIFKDSLTLSQEI